MEFGSAILSDLWGLETTTMPRYSSKREAVAVKFARVEAALGSGPFFAGQDFSLVDAVFAPIFRYFDVFDEFIDLSRLRANAEGSESGGRSSRSGQVFRPRSAGLSGTAARVPGPL